MSNPDSSVPYWQEPAGEGPYRDELYSRRAGNGRRSGANRPSSGSSGNGYVDRGEARSTGRRPGPARASGSQTEADLRARLGLGNGAPDSARARTGGPASGRYATPPGGPDGQGQRYNRGPGSGAVPRSNGGRAASRNGQRGRRAGGSQTEADLRARLGLGNGAPPNGNGYGGAHGYDGGNGFGGGGVSGYPAPGGRRGATALRERGATDLLDQRTSGPRRPRGYADGGGTGGGRGGGPGTRRKGDWWRRWTWRKAAAVFAGTFAFFMLLIVATIVYLYAHTQVPTDVSFAAVQQSSTVYYSNGKTQVGTFAANGIDRQMLTSGQIPAVMKNAIIAAEDRHFYTEGGISVSGIVRSAYEDLKGGGNLQGGSTLTEEFVKNYYTTVGTSRTVSTKLKEIFISIKLSHEESKDWILTQYLNTVPFGNNAYGIGAAAQIYFDETASKLTVSQSAMLAAMVNQPGFFSPDPKAGAAYQALVARWHYVLTNMVRDGAITQAQANAQKFPTVNEGAGLGSSWTGFRGYIMQAVENELENTYGYTQNQIETGGLKIVTTFNLKMMNGLYRAVNENLARMKADGQRLPSYAHVGALLEQPGTGDIRAMYGGPSYTARDCAKLDCQFNMATESRNLVGSSFKPYVLATAVKDGMNVQTSTLNAIEPMCIPPDSLPPTTLSTEATNCPPDWFPVNITGENQGPLSVWKATALSSDPGYEDLIHRAGIGQTIAMAKAFGVNTAAAGLLGKTNDVGVALGIGSLTVQEQATTFATLAADGEYATPHVVAQITQNGNQIPIKVTHRQVLTPAQAADVDYALSFDTQSFEGTNGTAFPNGVLNPVRPTIGKTGTTDVAQSAFFIGAIPQYSLGVGMFTNSQNAQPGGQTLNILPSVNGQLGGFGGTWPTTIWDTFMNNEFSTLPIAQLPTPNYVGFTRWDQVPVQPKKPKPQHQNPNPNPNQNGCPNGEHRVFGVCVPNPNPTNPNPNPTNPNPNPTPTVPTPPVQGTETAAAVLLAEEPTATAARRPGGG